MTHVSFPALALLAATLVAGCTDGLTPYSKSPGTVIATASDTGRDKIGLHEGEAAIAYDPDGCQGWIIDDGVEGYSSPRFDPKTGLPVCDNKYPPGTVLGPYETDSAPGPDRVSGPAKHKPRT